MLPDLPRLKATFRPQAWINDNAVDIDGQVEFDATENFLTLDLEEIRNFTEHDYDSDRLAWDLREAEIHSGPYEVDVDIDEWLNSIGFPARRQLTAALVRDLRKIFDIS